MTNHPQKAVVSGGGSDEFVEPRNCPSHGRYDAPYLQIMSTRLYRPCPACTEELRKQSAAIAAERRHNMRMASLEQSNVPPRFLSRTLSNFLADTPAQKSALNFAKDYAENWAENFKKGRCVLFVGRPGTGKTHLAVGIMSQILLGHESVSMRFSTVSSIIRRIKESFRKDSTEREADVIRSYTRCDLLVIDEVGVQFGTEFEKNALFEIINDRYEAQKPTILISNLSPDGVCEYLGERAFDRLHENGGRCIAFAWESHRRSRQ